MAISQIKAAQAKDLMKRYDGDIKSVAIQMRVSSETINRYLRAGKEIPDMPKDAKILLFDIETAPMKNYTWGIRDQFIGHFQIDKEWFVLSWAAKWLFGDTIYHGCVTPEEALCQDDSRMLVGMHDLIEEANILIAHNAARFDVRKLNYRFVTNGFMKPSPYSIIDTLKQAQKQFAASSHKMDHLTKTFGLSQKHETNFNLWVRCVSTRGIIKPLIDFFNGKITEAELTLVFQLNKRSMKKALDYMLEYNISDVKALEGLYLFIRPWITSHPNVAMLMGIKGNACGHCGSKELNWGINPYPTPQGKFEACRCMDCGAICHRRTSAVTKEERAYTLVSNAR